jgi:phosphate-selective porin OprO and OprP
MRLSRQERTIAVPPLFAVALILGFLTASVRATGETTDVRKELEELRQLIEAQQIQLDRQQQIIQGQQEALAQYDREHAETRMDAARAEEVRAIVSEVLADAGPRANPSGDGMSAGWDRGFFLRSADENFRLNIGGWVQARYAYERDSEGEDTSSFLIRRARLDIRGHVISPNLTFRIMPDLSRTATLRDAWINYAFKRTLQVRAGQFTVPFQWHRYVSPRRQHFAERSVPSETFGFPNGRDVGVMLHGAGEDRRWGYGVGFFDGAGRNVARSNSDGNMASGRFSYALFGQLPREESDFGWSEEPMLAVGIGGQGAWRNEVRAWDLGRSAAGNQRADWVTGTADLRFAWRGFSIASEGHLRRVDPDDSAVSSYDGWAGVVSAGYMIVPGRYEIVGRYSELRLDRDARDTREREWGVGLNIYHAAHDWKTRINLLRRGFAGRHELGFLVEHHVEF